MKRTVKCHVDLNDCRYVQRFYFNTGLECFKQVVLVPGHKTTAKDTSHTLLDNLAVNENGEGA